MRSLTPGLKNDFLGSRTFLFTAWCLVATAVGNKLLEDEDTISPTQKRIERNSHDHGHEGHGHGHHGEDGVDILDFFQAAGVRLTDGKDREGADDLGNDLDFLTPDVSPHHLANDAKMEELRQLFLSGGVSFGEIFARLSGEGLSGSSKSNTTERPVTSTARLPIKHHFHWEDPPTDLIMKNKVAEPVFAIFDASSRSTDRAKSFATRLDRKGRKLSMGGTVGGATTATPEYLTETQYYSPSEFEDVSRRGKSLESVLIGPLIGNDRNTRNKSNLGRTGDRRIDIDGITQKSNVTKSSKTGNENNETQVENDYSRDGYDYYEDYDRLLKDYYEGDYNDETFNKDDSNIKEESEEELPEITRTPRTPSRDADIDQSSRPLVGRRILSANPSQIHIENQHEMDHMMMTMLRNAIAQVEMEEHLLDIQDGEGRGGLRPNSNIVKNFAKKKKLQSSRFSHTNKPKAKTSVPFIPTKRPPVRARRPKILSKPVLNNNLGQTLIPPESVKSGDSLVDDYADYEYIYFYDEYDQDTKLEKNEQKKAKSQRQEEVRKKNEERKRLENQQKKAREEKSRMEKEERERKQKERETMRQAKLKLRQQEQLAKEEAKKRRRVEEQERRKKEQEDRKLQETRRLELGRRLEEEQNRLRQQQFTTSDNSKQNKQFAQRQQKLFRGQSLQTENSQQARKQLQREKAQERRRPKVLQSQTPRFQNRPAPVSPKKPIQKSTIPQNNDVFVGQTKSPNNALERPIKKSNLQQNNNKFIRPPQSPVKTTVNRSKPQRKQRKRPRVNSGRNRGRNLKQTQNRGRNFPFNGPLLATPPVLSRSIATTTSLPQTSKFISTLVTPQVTKPTPTFSQFQKRPRPRQKNQRRPNTPKRQRIPKVKGPVEPRIIPIANVRPPNAKPKANPIQASKNRSKGRSSKSSVQRNKNKNGFGISGEKRKSKAVGFGNKMESMFHNADNMPETSFTCSSQEYPGLYADPEVECRVFHMCHKNGRRSSFLCPIGTAFDQRFMVCNWKQKVDCVNAPNLYSLNRDLYKND